MKIVATEENIGKLFSGIMIPVSDITGNYRVLGWKCRCCGWMAGARGLPPSHECPHYQSEADKRKEKQ